MAPPSFTGQSADCATQPNTYWTGYRCACRVGFTANTGSGCVAFSASGIVFRPAEFIYKISLLYSNNGNNNNNHGDNDNNDNNHNNNDCGPNSYRDKDGQCVCKRGYVKSSKGCVPKDNNNNDCGTNEVYNPDKDACQCKNGYGKNTIGVCIDCSTVSNTFLYNGKCITCRSAQLVSGKKCVCPAGKGIIETGTGC